MESTDDRKGRERRGMTGRDQAMLWVGVGMLLLAAVVVVATRGSDVDPDLAGSTTVPSTVDSTVPDGETGTTTTVTSAERQPIIYVAPVGSDTASGQSAEAAVASLEQAFAVAVPGDEIRLLPGTYGFTQLEGVGGTAQAPITVTAPEGGVVFDPLNLDASDSLSMTSVQFIDFSGFTIRGGIHGTYIRASNNLTFTDMRWEDVGQEGVQINEGSTDLLFENCAVIRTGVREGDLDGIPFGNYGEGFYIGADSGVDPVARVTIRNCEIANTAAEAIDVKPGAFDIVIENNLIHDITTANSGAIVAGQVYQAVVPHFDANLIIRNNSIWNVTATSRFQDGNAINVNTPALIYNNVMWNLEHRGILVEANFENRDTTLVRIYNNTIFNAGLVPIEVRKGNNPGDVQLMNNIGSRVDGNIAASADLFVDAEAGDFRLVKGSAAIDAGVELPDVIGDRDGMTRPQGGGWDLGAFEADAALSPTTQAPTTQTPTTRALATTTTTSR